MNSKNTVASNLIWRLLERFGAQGVTLVVSIILARLLNPEIYGTVAIVTIFTTILQVFLDGGFSAALIQKKEVDNLDFSSVFYFNIIFGLTLYAVLYLVAPFIAFFYKMEELAPLIRVLGLQLIIFSVKSVQQAYISRNMMFKKFFFSTLGGTIGAAFVGIILAYKGYGVWALVIQQLFNMFVDTVILWFTVKWRPKMMFSLKRLKALLGYGWKLLASGLLDTIYNDLRQLIIGKMYSSSDLAYYNQGKKYTQVVVTNINTSIDSVLLPTMSQVQDNTSRVKAMTRRSIKISSFIMIPMMAGISACSYQLVDIILTSKWLPCVPFMIIFCIDFAFYPIHTANLNALKAMGRSDLFLKLEVAKKIVGLIILFSTIWFGPLIMAYSLLLSTAISMIINSWPNRTILNYSLAEQLKDILPYFLLALFMGVAVYCVSFLNFANWLTLTIQIPLGVIIYFSGAKLFKFDSFGYCLNIIKDYLHKNKRDESYEQN